MIIGSKRIDSVKEAGVSSTLPKKIERELGSNRVIHCDKNSSHISSVDSNSTLLHSCCSHFLPLTSSICSPRSTPAMILPKPAYAAASAFAKALWQDYVQMTPQANAIANALTNRGESIHHDHVAFRTYNLAPIRLQDLEPLFFDMGYSRHDEAYHFPSKKLDAFGYLPPSDDLPRIFLSELRVQELSTPAQNIIHRLVDSVDPSAVKDDSVFWAGPLWELPTWDEYELLASESEYAAWLSVIGLRLNHFALHINALNNITGVEDMNALVEELGFQVNESGGTCQGITLRLAGAGFHDCKCHARDLSRKRCARGHPRATTNTRNDISMSKTISTKDL